MFSKLNIGLVDLEPVKYHTCLSDGSDLKIQGQTSLTTVEHEVIVGAT